MFRDDATLADILLATRQLGEVTDGVDRSAFLNNIEKQSAVFHQLLVLGEAVRRLSPDVRDKHPDVSRSEIAAMRNRLIHGYDRVDLDVIWSTVNNKGPQLRAYVAELLSAEASEAGGSGLA